VKIFASSLSYDEEAKRLDDVGLYCIIPLGHVAEKTKMFQ
jgi:hypothetical protein